MRMRWQPTACLVFSMGAAIEESALTGHRTATTANQLHWPRPPTITIRNREARSARGSRDEACRAVGGKGQAPSTPKGPTTVACGSGMLNG